MRSSGIEPSDVAPTAASVASWASVEAPEAKVMMYAREAAGVADGAGVSEGAGVSLAAGASLGAGVSLGAGAGVSEGAAESEGAAVGSGASVGSGVGAGAPESVGAAGGSEGTGSAAKAAMGPKTYETKTMIWKSSATARVVLRRSVAGNMTSGPL